MYSTAVYRTMTFEVESCFKPFIFELKPADNRPRRMDHAPQSSIPDQIESAQAALDSLREQLIESQRLATVGTIAAVIAHEFNNLLTPITSYCQMALGSVEKGKLDDPLIKKALEKSMVYAERAGKICASLLDLVRGHSEHGAVSVQKIVDGALSVLSRDPMRDGISLRIHVRPGLEVRGDPIQLEQVLLNLLINARQAMLAEGSRGGSITIRADEMDDSSVKISISDTGPGIAPENVEKVFEPFFTTKTNPKAGEQKGTGLGLHICRQIVEQHHGQIEVESQVGRGTTFTIRLGKHNQALAA